MARLRPSPAKRWWKYTKTTSRPTQRRVAEPLLALEREASQRVVGDLCELAAARVRRRVEDERRVHEEVAHERDAGQELAVARRGRPPLRHGVDPYLGAGRDLPVHAWTPAGDVLGDVPVEVAHEPRQRLDGLTEGAQRALVAGLRGSVRAHDEEPVPTAPEVVQTLDELVQALPTREQIAGPGPRTRHAFERVVGEQTKKIEQRVPPGQPQVGESRRIVVLQVIDVEADDARETGALHELLRARAHGALGVHHDLTVVDVESQQGHASSRDVRGPGGGRARGLADYHRPAHL